MRKYTTNYRQTFILIAEDCAVSKGVVPQERKGQLTVAGLQYKLLHSAPYEFTSDEALFRVYAIRQQIKEKDWDVEKEVFFSKPQACFRASPLPKKFGWGIHFNEEGKMALIGKETLRYQALAKSKDLKIEKAMRTKRGA